MDYNYIDKYRCEGIMETKREQTSDIFKALSDPNRLMIVNMLQSGEKCACELLEELRIAQSTLSHHMKLLCASGVVAGRPNGKWTFYSLNKQGCEAAYRLLSEIMEASDKGDSNPSCTCE